MAASVYRLDKSTDFELSKLPTQRERNEWSRWESDKIRALWSFFKTLVRRSPSSNSHVVAVLKLLYNERHGNSDDDGGGAPCDDGRGVKCDEIDVAEEDDDDEEQSADESPSQGSAGVEAPLDVMEAPLGGAAGVIVEAPLGGAAGVAPLGGNAGVIVLEAATPQGWRSVIVGVEESDAEIQDKCFARAPS